MSFSIVCENLISWVQMLVMLAISPAVRSRLTRIVPLVLLLTAVATYFGWLSPGASREFVVTLELQGPTSDITQVQTLWTPADDAQKQPIAGSTLRYSAGKAPRKIRTKLRAPNGHYEVEIMITKTAGTHTVRRNLALDTRYTTLFVGTE